MTLIFETPSRNCPFRMHNGEAVTLIAESPRRKHVRRIGSRVREYLVRGESGRAWTAYPDELHIIP